jgi:hypothetical protein
VESHNHLHHANRLGQWAEEVVITETVLLQEIFANNTRDLKRDLLILRQRVLADQLHNLLQIILLLQNLLHGLLKCAIFRVIGFEPGLQDANVLGEGNIPIDGWEMLTLCKLLIQPPEALLVKVPLQSWALSLLQVEISQILLLQPR